MNLITLKCRKCRHILLNDLETPLLSGHNIKVGVEYFRKSLEQVDCLEAESSLFLQEEGLPGWIIEIVNEAEWQKGKLHCPNCSLRLGSFNFISGRKCACGKFIVPPVHIIKSKVDWSISSGSNL
uniref:Putative e3 ubiquitin-protein ligase n=1 Tax=Triatoma infestans TaxID=30076 RepID=A0A023F7C9_TRIIF